MKHVFVVFNADVLFDHLINILNAKKQSDKEKNYMNRHKLLFLLIPCQTSTYYLRNKGLTCLFITSDDFLK